MQGHEKEELVVSSHALSLGHKKDLETNYHMALPCQIKGHALVSLVDNGASGLASISSSLTQSLDLTLYPSSRPRTLVAYDGKATASAITQYTIIPLHISRHSENLSAFVAPIAKWPLILGLPWLAKHNPYVDWKR
jgi:predicted aspartyl protease